MESIVYLFCAWSPSQPGHFLYAPAGKRVCWKLQAAVPWGERELDSQLCPKVRGSRHSGVGHQIEGHANLHYKNGWTALAFWDRSVDHRFNSKTIVVVQGLHEVSVVLNDMLKDFAGRWALIDCPIAVQSTSMDYEAKRFFGVV